MPTRTEIKARTRRALLDAGRTLLVSEGLDAPSLDRICAEAGYTRGAFYVHFEDRDDFMAAVMETFLADYTAAIVKTADPGRDLERSIAAFVGGLLARQKEDIPLSLMLEGCARSERVRQRFVATVTTAIVMLAATAAAGADAGVIRKDLDATATAQTLIACVFGVLALRQAGLDAALDGMAHTLVRALQHSQEEPE